MKRIKSIPVTYKAQDSWHTILLMMAFIGALIFLTRPLCGYADSLRELSLEEKSNLADEIVVGKVTSSLSSWQGRLIVTVSTIQVQESIKGQPGPAVEITQLGGTAVHPGIHAPVHMSASGSAVLNSGEEVLLFVRKTKGGTRDLIGGPQGKLVVSVDPVTGEKIIPVGPKEIEGSDQDGKRKITLRQMTLNEVRQRIKKEMQAGSKVKKPGGVAP